MDTFVTKLNFEKAKAAGEQIASDLQKLEDWVVESTFTFKNSRMRHFDFSEDRINKVLDVHQFVSRYFDIKRKQLSIFIKDEFQNKCGHCHVLTGGKIFRERGITGSQVGKAIRQWWEGVGFWSPVEEQFENLDSKKKNYLMYNNDLPEWFSEEGYRFKREPKVGWVKTRGLGRKKEDDLMNLISYSSKYVKGKNVVGLTHHCSSTLSKRMNNLYM